jgi:hypothetical protein
MTWACIPIARWNCRLAGTSSWNHTSRVSCYSSIPANCGPSRQLLLAQPLHGGNACGPECRVFYGLTLLSPLMTNNRKGGPSSSVHHEGLPLLVAELCCTLQSSQWHSAAKHSTLRYSSRFIVHQSTTVHCTATQEANSCHTPAPHSSAPAAHSDSGPPHRPHALHLQEPRWPTSHSMYTALSGCFHCNTHQPAHHRPCLPQHAGSPKQIIFSKKHCHSLSYLAPSPLAVCHRTIHAPTTTLWSQ